MANWLFALTVTTCFSSSSPVASVAPDILTTDSFVCSPDALPEDTENTFASAGPVLASPAPAKLPTPANSVPQSEGPSKTGRRTAEQGNNIGAMHMVITHLQRFRTLPLHRFLSYLLWAKKLNLSSSNC